jgi:hypothetical protein
MSNQPARPTPPPPFSMDDLAVALPAGATQESANGRFARPSSSATRFISTSPGYVSTGVYGIAAGASALLVSMSSGKEMTTGPGRPDVAIAKARVTISGMRAASSISVAHFAMGPKKAR